MEFALLTTMQKLSCVPTAQQRLFNASMTHGPSYNNLESMSDALGATGSTNDPLFTVICDQKRIDGMSLVFCSTQKS
jgi:hypothetical protein